MRGHVARKGNRWYPVVSVYDETGTRKRRWHPGHDTKREASKALTDILSRLDGGTYVEPTKRLLGDYLLNEWLPAVRETLRPTTAENYRMIVERYICPRIGGVSLQALTAPRLNAFYSDLLREGRLRGKTRTTLAPRTVRLVHAVIRKALADAVEWSLVIRNVADAAKPPKRVKPPKRTWNPEQLRAFLAHVADDPLYAAFLVLITTGMRRGEVLGLRWVDVDLEARRLSVVQTIVAPTYHRVELSEPKTDRGRRRIVLDEATIAALVAHRERQRLECALLGANWRETDLVFAAVGGVPLRPQSVTERFKRLTTGARLPVVRLHDLRHTYATIALRSGVHPKVVSDRLGHASIAFTLDVYSDSVPVLEETAAELVAAEILGGG